MKTTQILHFENAACMTAVEEESIALVVTSPPYPMIEMWDESFCIRNPDAERELQKEMGDGAFEAMHRELDAVWGELYRVLVPGGIACINIGDAVRTLRREFALYPSHARILSGMRLAGFQMLPGILWRKPTNAPNKFMGSGMMPPGAYVTLEHEHILVFRKGNKRPFRGEEEARIRRESAFFWEERNIWFSDVWMDLPGTVQRQGNRTCRERSAAFPMELPYRLVNMFSVKGDRVLDPFLGTGTTLCACLATGRNGIGYEIDRNFQATVEERLLGMQESAAEKIEDRLSAHLSYCDARRRAGRSLSYQNRYYGFPVTTRQERELLFNLPVSIRRNGSCCVNTEYLDGPHKTFPEAAGAPLSPAFGKKGVGSRQRRLDFSN